MTIVDETQGIILTGKDFIGLIRLFAKCYGNISTIFEGNSSNALGSLHGKFERLRDFARHRGTLRNVNIHTTC